MTTFAQFIACLAAEADTGAPPHDVASTLEWLAHDCPNEYRCLLNHLVACGQAMTKGDTPP